eukprot:scaffold2853_cov246-Pinguiococcus_pyrenoidosus.AAC.6
MSPGEYTPGGLKTVTDDTTGRVEDTETLCDGRVETVSANETTRELPSLSTIGCDGVPNVSPSVQVPGESGPLLARNGSTSTKLLLPM